LLRVQYANLTTPPDWFRRDFGKPNETISTHSQWAGKLLRAWSRPLTGPAAAPAAGGPGTVFLLQSSIVDDAGDAAFAHEQVGVRAAADAAARCAAARASCGGSPNR
jgi:hypothetical protein